MSERERGRDRGKITEKCFTSAADVKIVGSVESVIFLRIVAMCYSQLQHDAVCCT